MTFGKYKGEDVYDIIGRNPRYLIWVSSNLKYVDVSDYVIERCLCVINSNSFDTFSHADDDPFYGLDPH